MLPQIPRCVWFVHLGVSISVFLLGILGHLIIVPITVNRMLNEEMRLTPKTTVFENWVNFTDPIFFSAHVFNITNPVEFELGEKPYLQELGPYVYLQKRTKNIRFINDDKVTYGEHKSYRFMPQYSSGSPEKDHVYALNIPLVSIVRIVENTNFEEDVVESIIQPIIEALINKHKEHLVVHRTVDEMLFGGYATPIVMDVAKLAKTFMPDVKFPAQERFGLLFGKNNTAEHKFTVGTGAGRYPFAEILDWNGNAQLHYWATAACNEINGTDGSQFAPNVRNDKILYVFSTDLCRSIYLIHEKTTQVKGLTTERFTVPEELYASAEKVQANRCFCETPRKCRSGGVINVSACHGGLPIMVSAPHFYMGEARLTTDVGGLKSQKEKHETFLDISPITGLVLRAGKRVQINIDLKQSSLAQPLSNISNRIIPVVWIEERMEATSRFTDLLKQGLIHPRNFVIGLCVVATLSGGLSAMVATIVISIRDAKYLKSAKLGARRTQILAK